MDFRGQVCFKRDEKSTKDVPAPTPGALNPMADSKMKTTVKVIHQAVTRVSTSGDEAVVSIHSHL